MAGLKLAAAIAGGLAAFWWIDKEAAASIKSAGGNETMIEKFTTPWLKDLNTKGAAWKAAFFAAEDRHGIPRYLLARLGWQESRYDPLAVSPAGAQGLMQFMPATAREMGIDPFNPEQAIDGAARYLVKQYQRFGTWELALKAYNWGPGNVSKWLKAGKIGEPKETRNYSAQILVGYTAATGKVIV